MPYDCGTRPLSTMALLCLALSLPQAANAVAASVARGYQLIEQGRLEEAHRELSAVVASDPKSVDGLILLGMTNYHLRRDAEAIANLEEVLKLEPASVQAHYVLGQVYLRKD